MRLCAKCHRIGHPKTHPDERAYCKRQQTRGQKCGNCGSTGRGAKRATYDCHCYDLRTADEKRRGLHIGASAQGALRRDLALYAESQP